MNLDEFDGNRACDANKNASTSQSASSSSSSTSTSSSSSSSSPQDIGIFPLKNARRVNNNDDDNNNNNNNSSNNDDDLYDVVNCNGRNISSNFYLITQYILQAYFKVPFGELRTLNLVDLIVDQTFAGSLTLRKLNNLEGASSGRRRYEYFGTVARQEDITRCPIFALATYFVIRWSDPNPPFTVENFDRMRLLDTKKIICWNKEIGELNYTKERSQVSRAFCIEPLRELADVIFPWMPSLRQDMEVVDRTNYKLHSFLELFEFMAQVIIQDLKFLELHPGLLSNIVAFVSKFIPDLFGHANFQNIDASLYDARKRDIGNRNLDGGESHFLDLSKRLTTENIRLAQQITQLENDLSNVQSVCGEILRLQRQLVGGSRNIGGGGAAADEASRENLSLAPMLASIPLVNSNNNGDNSGIDRKRKLPPPPLQPGFSPFPISTNPYLPAVMESPYTKRLRVDDKPTPSQAALDLLLSKTMSSPRLTSLHSAHPSKIPSRYSSPTAFGMAGSPSAVLPQNPIAGVPPSQSRVNSNTGGIQTSSPISPAALPDPVASINNHGVNSLPNTPIVSAGTSELKGNQQENSNDEEDDSSNHKSTDQIPSGISNGNNNNNNNNNNNKQLKLTGPNRHIKYKLSRENKTIWDLYTEWYIGLNGQPSIKSLIENYGLRRWKVSDDSHFFPTRRIIMDYIEIECDRGIKYGRFTNCDQSREGIRKIIVGDLEKFRINNGLTLNSLSLYFKNLTRENKEICIFENFKSWGIRAMAEEEKNRYCKRQHTKDAS